MCGVSSTDSTVDGVEYIDNAKHRTPFIAADGDAETQPISESSHDPCSIVNKFVWSKYVDNSKRVDFVYISRRLRTEQNLLVRTGKSQPM